MQLIFSQTGVATNTLNGFHQYRVLTNARLTLQTLRLPAPIYGDEIYAQRDAIPAMQPYALF